MPDCKQYEHIDLQRHSAEVLLKEPERYSLRAQITSESLRKRVLVQLNGHGGETVLS